MTPAPEPVIYQFAPSGHGDVVSAIRGITQAALEGGVRLAVRAMLEGSTLARERPAKHRPLLRKLLCAVERSDPQPLDREAQLKQWDADPELVVVWRELGELFQRLGVAEAEDVPNELRWALLAALDLREPLAPRWVRPGEHVFNPWRCGLGDAYRIETVTERGVLLVGDRETIPMGRFVVAWELNTRPITRERNVAREIGEWVHVDAARALRAFGQALESAVTSLPTRAELCAYVDRTVTDPAAHSALVTLLEQFSLSVAGVWRALGAVRRFADCQARGYRPARAREEGFADLIAGADWDEWGDAGPIELWASACDAFDRARGRR
jgi:hypothetical protein